MTSRDSGEGSVVGAFALLYRFMSPARRRQAAFLALLMPVSALAEMVSIAAIVPLLSLLSGERGRQDLPWLTDLLRDTAGQLNASPLTIAGALFIVAALTVAATRLLLARSSQRFAYGLGHEVAVEIQRRVLSQPYLFHVAHHSSRVIASLHKVEQFIFALMLPLVQGIGAAIIALFIVAALLWVDARSTMLALVSVSAAYAIALFATRKRLDEISATMGDAHDKRIKTIQESLGAIRDIIIDHSQPVYVEAFRGIDERLTSARMDAAILAIVPRYIIEAVGMVVFAVLALSLASSGGGLTAALPVLGALALGAQRLLPLIQQVYRGWTSLAGSRSIVGQLVELLQLPVPHPGDAPRVEFRNSIKLEDVAFAYEGRSRPAVSGINLTIPKGARVALIGRTGSGKTTLTDLIMGLIAPAEGRILIDDVALDRTTARGWQQNIAHVPQTIFLADATIAANIALAPPESSIDMERVRMAARTAQLDEFIDDLPEGFETLVGERGVRLSGGQRQRLGLARAIYKQAPVLLLDEATSALDDATEEAVLQALDELGKQGCTILIVAHRASTIATCDELVRLDAGRIVDIEQRKNSA